MRILVVDDDAITQSLIENVLIQAGHEVELADNGQQAYEVLQHRDFRLIITDWEMPEMNGAELCRAIRNNDSLDYVYIILLTSHSNSQNVVEGLSAGADDFIGKPFNAEELQVRVQVGQRIISMETRDVAIFALAKLTESRDPETGAHLERVQNYCRILARQLARHSKYSDAIDQDYIKLIYTTSPLHDIGKVGIPDNILLKPGQLTDREYEIMKTHTLVGAETLNAALVTYPNAKFLEMARDIALHHHERYDGNGYPNKLVGDDIPLCGRIVALADVYDALTSKRVYKDAFAHDLAHSIIVEERGTHFDPDVVDAFLENTDEFNAIREQLQESSLLNTAL
jgi:putative two-component system response regulator